MEELYRLLRYKGYELEYDNYISFKDKHGSIIEIFKSEHRNTYQLCIDGIAIDCNFKIDDILGMF